MRAGGWRCLPRRSRTRAATLAVYEVGRAVGELPGVLEARDMTPEAVAVKLMWALGQTGDREKAARLFETPIEYDIM